MPYRKRAKSKRRRGLKTHGFGAKKKHRGSGNRGGKGMAGLGKRAKHKKPSVWKNKLHFGRHGFKILGKKKQNSVSLRFIDDNIERLESQGFAKKTSDGYEINLTKLGIQKLVGSGRITRKVNVRVLKASAGAVKKIKEAGGTVESEIPEVSEKSETKMEEAQ